MVIDQIGYNFSTFDIKEFLQHIEAYRNRSLIVNYLPFGSDLFGFWYPTQHADYIFINATLHPTHRAHTLLHEIAHMLLNHRGIDLTTVLGTEMCAALGIEPGKGHLRSAVGGDALQEEEAEWFVLSVQRQIVSARRLHELYGDPTSLSAMQPYVNPLNYNH
jgi:hypothetical protein